MRIHSLMPKHALKNQIFSNLKFITLEVRMNILRYFSMQYLTKAILFKRSIFVVNNFEHPKFGFIL